MSNSREVPQTCRKYFDREYSPPKNYKFRFNNQIKTKKKRKEKQINRQKTSTTKNTKKNLHK